MTDRVLFVDDEPNVLAAFERQFRRQYSVSTAESGPAALALMESGAPYAVVVSDMRMPGMDGAEFLTRAHQRAPDTVRLLLTGHAELSAAIRAVNEGYLFRFLTKPCQPGELSAAVAAGVRQHQLVTAERELLEKTLRGSVQVMAEVMALVNPAAYERALRLQDLARRMAPAVPGADDWQVDVAVLLSELGAIVVDEPVPPELAAREPSHPRVVELRGRADAVTLDLVARIPRLEPIAAILRRRNEPYAGGGAAPLGARLLRLLSDYDDQRAAGAHAEAAVARLGERPGCYDPALVAALRDVVARRPAGSRLVPVARIECGMTLASDLLSDTGACLLRGGAVINAPILHRLTALWHERRIPGELPVLADGD